MLTQVNHSIVNSGQINSVSEQEMQESKVSIPLIPADVEQAFNRTHLSVQQACELNSLDKIVYLPKSNRILSLCYLTMFEIHKEKNLNPFDEESIKLFHTSRKWTRLALRELKWAAIPLFIPAAIGGFTTYLAVSTLSPVKLAGTVGAINTASSYVSNLLGWRITGTNPDRSQTAANDKDLALQLLTEYYNEMAIDLINLSFQEPEFAQAIAAHTNLDLIFSAAQKQSGLHEHEIKLVFKHFRSAIHYITHSELPSQTALQQCITLNQVQIRSSQLTLLFNQQEIRIKQLEQNYKTLMQHHSV